MTCPMTCPYLSGLHLPLCTAYGEEPYVPSSFEREEYCSTDRHRICPFYRWRETRGTVSNSAPLAGGKRGGG